MATALTAEQRRRLLDLLQRELRDAAGAALEQGTTPAELAEVLDERRAALGRLLAGRGLGPSSGQDDLQDRGDDPGEPGRVA